MIDWTDPTCHITPHFSVHEALFIPSWNVHHIPSESEKANILAMADRMEVIRAFLGNKPINVHCWIRPTHLNAPGTPHHNQNYNALVGGALASSHIVGDAVDYDVVGMSCDAVRAALLPKLEEFGLRMENNPHSGWVHNDRRHVYPGGVRYFKV